MDSFTTINLGKKYLSTFHWTWWTEAESKGRFLFIVPTKSNISDLGTLGHTFNCSDCFYLSLANFFTSPYKNFWLPWMRFSYSCEINAFKPFLSIFFDNYLRANKYFFCFRTMFYRQVSTFTGRGCLAKSKLHCKHWNKLSQTL